MAIWQNTPVISKVKLPGGSENIYYIKDAEARAKIEALGSPTHFAGVTTSNIKNKPNTNPIVVNEASYTASAGDIVVYGNGEFIWDGSNWVEFGDLSDLGNLAYHDIEDIKITISPKTTDSVLGADTAFTAADSSVTFASGAGSNFVTGYNNDAVAPTFTEGQFTPASLGSGFYTAGTKPSFTEGAFTPAAIKAGFVTEGSAASFTEGAFTPAEIQSGFVTPGSAASYEHSGFSGGSLGAETKAAFASEGVVAAMDTTDTEMLVLSAASTAQAVTAQGNFSPAVYGTDTFDGGTPTAIDVTKFSGGSKAADKFVANVPTAVDTSKFDGGSKAKDTFSAGTMAAIDMTKFNGGSKAADVFNAGSAATLAVAKALTASDTGTAAAQTVTAGTNDLVNAITEASASASYKN